MHAEVHAEVQKCRGSAEEVERKCQEAKKQPRMPISSGAAGKVRTGGRLVVAGGGSRRIYWPNSSSQQVTRSDSSLASSSNNNNNNNINQSSSAGNSQQQAKGGDTYAKTAGGRPLSPKGERLATFGPPRAAASAESCCPAATVCGSHASPQLTEKQPHSKQLTMNKLAGQLIFTGTSSTCNNSQGHQQSQSGPKMAPSGPPLSGATSGGSKELGLLAGAKLAQGHQQTAQKRPDENNNQSKQHTSSYHVISSSSNRENSSSSSLFRSQHSQAALNSSPAGPKHFSANQNGSSSSETLSSGGESSKFGKNESKFGKNGAQFAKSGKQFAKSGTYFGSAATKLNTSRGQSGTAASQQQLNFSSNNKVNLKYVKTLIILLMAIDLLVTLFVHHFAQSDHISLAFFGSSSSVLRIKFSTLNVALSSLWFITLIGAILFDIYSILLIAFLLDTISFLLLLCFSIIHFTYRIDYNSVNLTSFLLLLFAITVLHLYLIAMAALTMYLMLAVKRRRNSRSVASR